MQEVIREYICKECGERNLVYPPKNRTKPIAEQKPPAYCTYCGMTGTLHLEMDKTVERIKDFVYRKVSFKYHPDGIVDYRVHDKYHRFIEISQDLLNMYDCENMCCLFNIPPEEFEYHRKQNRLKEVVAGWLEDINDDIMLRILKNLYTY